jgi:hypothetical protein
MANQPDYYNDGNWTAGFQAGATLVTYPFVNYSAPDVYARVSDLAYKILPINYTPLTATRTSYTNLILQSESFATTWTATNATPSSAGRANPNTGEVTMFKVLETVTNGEHYLTQSYSFTAGTYVFSFFVAGGLGRDYVYAKVYDGASNDTCFFNYTTGAVGTSSGATGSIRAMPDGSYRCSMVVTVATGSGAVFIQSASDASTISYAGDTAKGFYVWGAQLQVASAVGPYISTTSIARTISSPDWQPTVDTFAYLAKESDLTLDAMQRASFNRYYFRIPKEETSYPGSMYVPLPVPQNQYAGAASLPATQFNYFYSLGDGAYQGNSIYTPVDQALYKAKEVTGVTLGTASAGTFTVTYNSSTTAPIAYDAMGAAIDIVVNALATVIADGLTVSVTNSLPDLGYLGFTISYGTAPAVWPKVFTLNAGSLTVTTSANTATQIASLTSQNLCLPAHLTIASHGLITSVALATVGTSSIILTYPVASWGSIDANTIWVPTLPPAIGSTWAYAGSFVMTYPAGTTYLLSALNLEQYYLPGVTSGITTPADIPVPTNIQAPADFLNALVTTTGFQTYQSNGPAPWMDSLIYKQTLIKINLDGIG